MNEQTRDPEQPDDDDIPTLTEIIVPGRLRAEPPVDDGAAPAPPGFVFDIDFAPTDARGEQAYDSRAQSPAAESISEPAFELPAQASLPGQEAELPLPWAAKNRPERVETEAAAPAIHPGEMEPLVVAPGARAGGGLEPPDPDAQARLRELLAEIGNGLERRLQEELALTEQRLRAALREELDTRLRELLAGTPPTA